MSKTTYVLYLKAHNCITKHEVGLTEYINFYVNVVIKHKANITVDKNKLFIQHTIIKVFIFYYYYFNNTRNIL